MTTYNVALKEGVDYDAFWTEIETDGSGGVYVPQRGVDIVNARPTSLRQCWYDLTDTEAGKLRDDSRVYCVEIPPEFRTDIQIHNNASQTGLYYKSPGTNPANNSGINWGLFRLNSTTMNTTGASGTLTYNYPLDGTGVDFVIQDSGCQVDHPEFQDAAGVTRVQQIDWFTASGIAGTMPANFYTDYDGHGTHCTGIAAGKTYGRAKNARIYVMTVSGLNIAPTNGISTTNVFDCIKGWHNNKTVDPALGYKRPTVVNMSWGYINTFTSITGGVYRGTPWVGSTKQASYGMIGDGNNYFGIRVDSVDVDVAECLAAGVILVGAAGNYYQTVDVLGGPDYDNYFTATLSTNRYYMRGGSPACTAGVICVGNVTTLSDTPEEKSGSSESGPRVDAWAPGTNIVSTTSTTNKFGATTAYPFNSNYKIMSISGTSMASPQVAGLAAQLLQVYPTATPAQIRQKIINTSIPNMLYTTGLSTDYSNSRSLHGGPNQYAYQAFNTASGGNVAGPVTTSNTGIRT
jgi:subtilisin family serine protease